LAVLKRIFENTGSNIQTKGDKDEYQYEKVEQINLILTDKLLSRLHEENIELRKFTSILLQNVPFQFTLPKLSELLYDKYFFFFSSFIVIVIFNEDYNN